MLSFLNVIGIYYELYQGVVRDWLFDLIANNVGIVLGLLYAHRKFDSASEQVYSKNDSEYLRSALRRRLNQRKKDLKFLKTTISIIDQYHHFESDPFVL